MNNEKTDSGFKRNFCENTLFIHNIVIIYSTEKGGGTVAQDKKARKVIALNRKARHDYFVDDTFEAGIELFGTEVKSLRAGTVNLKDSYCRIINGELFAFGVHISPYEKGNIYNKDPLRVRRLLMHKKEIGKLFYAVSRDGCTLIPLSLYFSGSRVKMELGLCRGKKLYDKREADAKRQAGREMERYSKLGRRDG